MPVVPIELLPEVEPEPLAVEPEEEPPAVEPEEVPPEVVPPDEVPPAVDPPVEAAGVSVALAVVPPEVEEPELLEEPVPIPLVEPLLLMAEPLVFTTTPATCPILWLSLLLTFMPSSLES